MREDIPIHLALESVYFELDKELSDETMPTNVKTILTHTKRLVNAIEEYSENRLPDIYGRSVIKELAKRLQTALKIKEQKNMTDQ